MMRAKSAPNHIFPGPAIPNLNLAGLCDKGWISSQESMFALAGFLFFVGTVLALYTSLAGIIQVAGFVTFYQAFGSANAAVVSGLPSGSGPKLALVSMILVITGMLFPVYIWSKTKLDSIWRRFITIAPQENVHQTIPMMFAAAGAAVLYWGWAVSSSSIYEDAALSAALFAVAGLALLGAAIFAMIVAWKTD
jgi:hypothetical protein